MLAGVLPGAAAGAVGGQPRGLHAAQLPPVPVPAVGAGAGLDPGVVVAVMYTRVCCGRGDTLSGRHAGRGGFMGAGFSSISQDFFSNVQVRIFVHRYFFL